MYYLLILELLNPLKENSIKYKVEDFQENHIGVDIEQTSEFSSILNASKYIFWNGRWYFETDEYSTGTREITKLYQCLKYISVGGGDSVMLSTSFLTEKSLIIFLLVVEPP